ncbi:MAG: hypothetical protein K6F86_05945 [Lachnospiraceae bacterium]|nr:hypothetical protein [Lachnospiraceae bacterium]
MPYIFWIRKPFQSIISDFTATTLIKPAAEYDRMLFRVQEFIGEEPEKGRILWNAINFPNTPPVFENGEITDEELLDLLQNYC